MSCFHCKLLAASSFETERGFLSPVWTRRRVGPTGVSLKMDCVGGWLQQRRQRRKGCRDEYFYKERLLPFI